MNQAQWIVVAAQAKAPAAEGEKPQGMNPLFLLLLVGVFFYLIILRPQSREKKQRQQMLSNIKKGDRVVTAGGIHGKVADVDSAHGIVTMEIAPKTAIKVNLGSVSVVMQKDAGKTDSPSSDEGEPKAP